MNSPHSTITATRDGSGNLYSSIPSSTPSSAYCAMAVRNLGQDRRIARTTESTTLPEAHNDPFAQRFGKTLPRRLRLEAGQMTWPAFEAAYAPPSGALQLAAWTEERINSSKTQYTATLGIKHTTHNASIAAAGPISAMTVLLHEAGYPVEIMSFHQQQAGAKTATFIECTNGARQRWAMGIGDDCTDSILNAFVSAANLLGTD